MKKIQHLAVALFVCLFSFVGMNAQTYTGTNSDTKLESFNKKNAENSFLTNQANNSSAQRMNGVNAGVFIAQIGNNNDINVTSTAVNNAIDIQQNGTGNNTFLSVDAQTVVETVRQNGDNNSFLDFGSTARIHNLEVVQSGSNQNLVFHGGNSISERMNIRMSGDSQSVIVRNFN